MIVANEFEVANHWQQKYRNRYLKHFYQKFSLDGRYVYIDKSACSTLLQKQLAVDTIFQSIKDESSICVEEKIDSHCTSKNFALETDSCTVKGREKQGWMHYAKADYLLYAFAQESGLILYFMSFPLLQQWFWQNYTNYREHVTDQLNHTAVRLVPIADVKQNVPTAVYRCTDGGCIRIRSNV